MPSIYKLVPASLWAEAETTGAFTGAPVDLKDGYIHFSTAGQVEETAVKYFTGVANLLLVTVDTSELGAGLRWEPARGALFPHLYAPLPLAAVRSVVPLPLGADGRHEFGSLLA